MLFAGTPDGVYRLPRERFERPEQVLTDVSVRALHRGHDAVYAATGSGLLVTDDGGETWSGLSVPVDDVHAVHENGGLYAGVRPAALYRSATGETWERVDGFDEFAAEQSWPTNPHRDEAWVRDVTRPPGSPETLLVGVEVGGLVASTDGGTSWQTFEAVPDDVHDIVAVSQDNWVVSCGVGGPDGHGGVFETGDGGESWTERELGQHEYVRESCYDGRLYTAGNESGPLWSSPDAALFVEREGEMESVAYPGAPESYVISWASASDGLYAGTNDGAVLRGPGEWEQLGEVPVSDKDQRAWGVRSLAVCSP